MVFMPAPINSVFGFRADSSTCIIMNRKAKYIPAIFIFVAVIESWYFLVLRPDRAVQTSIRTQPAANIPVKATPTLEPQIPGPPVIRRNPDPLSPLSFDYPDSWHIRVIPPDADDGKVVYLLDPDQIPENTVLIPSAVVRITDNSGYPVPEEALQQNIASRKRSMTDVFVSNFAVGDSRVYRISGNGTLSGQTVPINEYHTLMTVPGAVPELSRVVRAQLTYYRSGPEYGKYSEVLDRIIISMKVH